MTPEVIEIIKEINLHIKTIAQDSWVMLYTISTFLVALIALYSSNQETIHNLIFRPRLELAKNIKITIQGTSPQLFISRIRITNRRGRIAKNVNFIVEELFYKKKSKWVKAEGFVPFPLNWMHVDKEFQDLHRDRDYYLDLCKVVARDDPYIEISSPPRFGSPRGHGIDDLTKGENKVKITCYGDNIRKESFWIEIVWYGAFQLPILKFSNKK